MHCTVLHSDVPLSPSVPSSSMHCPCRLLRVWEVSSVEILGGVMCNVLYCTWYHRVLSERYYDVTYQVTWYMRCYPWYHLVWVGDDDEYYNNHIHNLSSTHAHRHYPIQMHNIFRNIYAVNRHRHRHTPSPAHTPPKTHAHTHPTHTHTHRHPVPYAVSVRYQPSPPAQIHRHPGPLRVVWIIRHGTIDLRGEERG
jgi:hypothetical protein